MKKITKQKWVNALRSGKFEQGKGRLCTDEKYCCLGVLAKITGNLVINGGFRGIGGSFYHLGRWGEDSGSTFSLLPEDTQDSLVLLNDTKGYSFPEIADWIEENIKTED